MSRPQSLTNHCAGCGAPDRLAHPILGDYKCPACCALEVRYNAAGEHLEALLNPIITAWSSHWQQQGLSEQEVNELLLGVVNPPRKQQTTAQQQPRRQLSVK